MRTDPRVPVFQDASARADIYSHVGPALQREAADRLDAALR
jgi:hypothetical protein